MWGCSCIQSGDAAAYDDNKEKYPPCYFHLTLDLGKKPQKHVKLRKNIDSTIF